MGKIRPVLKADTINSDGSTIRINNGSIRGDMNKIIGDGNHIIGDMNKIIGDGNHIIGDMNTCRGYNNTSNGDMNSDRSPKKIKLFGGGCKIKVGFIPPPPPPPPKIICGVKTVRKWGLGGFNISDTIYKEVEKFMKPYDEDFGYFNNCSNQ